MILGLDHADNMALIRVIGCLQVDSTSVRAAYSSFYISKRHLPSNTDTSVLGQLKKGLITL